MNPTSAELDPTLIPIPVHGKPALLTNALVSPPPSGNWALWKRLLSLPPFSTHYHPGAHSPLFHKQTHVPLLFVSCLQSLRCSPCTCARCPELPALQTPPEPPSGPRAGCAAKIKPGSSGNHLINYSKNYHLWDKFTAQSSLHTACHTTHAVCAQVTKSIHVCGFKNYNLHSRDMVHTPLQAPSVLRYKATSFLAQNKGKTPSLVSRSSKPALPALHRGTARPSEPA